jgi:hypothetical protein
MTGMDAYVAPAARVLTVLHRPDPDREADLFGREERIDGWTACGLPFLESELWMPIERRDGDRVCPGCGELTEDGYVQEVLI